MFYNFNMSSVERSMDTTLPGMVMEDLTVDKQVPVNTTLSEGNNVAIGTLSYVSIFQTSTFNVIFVNCASFGIIVSKWTPEMY